MNDWLLEICLKIRGRFFLGPSIVSIVTLDGVSFYIGLDPGHGFLDRQIFKYRRWEPEISSLMHQNLKSGMTFLDVGANIGYHSICAAKIVGPSGKVIVFEPQTQILESLKNNIKLNNLTNVQVNSLALGAETAIAELSLDYANLGASRILPQITGISEKIRVTSLDDFTKEEGIDQLDLIKVDVEGYELGVFKGAVSTFDLLRPKCIFEFSPCIWQYQKLNWKRISTELLNFFFVRNYTLFDVKRRVYLEQETLSQYIGEFNGMVQTDILAVPRD